jgi:organic radical activating enzyme
MIDKLTFSLCPACYKTVPALITKSADGVFILKNCKEHGNFKAVVERDPRWYESCLIAESGKFYDGYFIDVTDKCNLKCKYCFHPVSGKDRSVDDIVAEATEAASFAPFLLTGGEPTMHPDLPEIVRKLSAIGETWVLTNGVKFCDEKYLDELCAAGLQNGKELRIGFSIHTEMGANDINYLLYFCRDRGLKIGSVQFVIDDLTEIGHIVRLYEMWKDTISLVKIKAASNLWREKSVKSTIFTSDMVNYLSTLGDTVLVPGAVQKVSMASVLFNGLFIHLVSWYDVNNVDLWDINCPPYYRAKDGKIRDFVTSCLVNEGEEEVTDGIRVRRAVWNDVEKVSYLWVELTKENKPDSTPNRIAWELQTKAMVSNPNHYLLVAEKGGHIIGFQSGDVALEPGLDKMCVLGRYFYVKPEYRAGVAARKLNELTMILGKRAGVTDILRPITPQLMDFWEKKGCEVVNIMIRTGYV